MFSPEKVAEQYVENTAENDGYDALKYTVLIKNTKFGNFISENYMDKYIDENATAPAMTAVSVVSPNFSAASSVRCPIHS